VLPYLWLPTLCAFSGCSRITGNAEVIPADPIRAITSGWPTIRELEAVSRGVQEWLSAENCLTGTLTDAGGWAAIMPGEETESLGGFRSQRRRRLPSVDE
jgi:hypothetical protein